MISSPHLSMAYFYLLVLMPVLSSCQELFFLLEPFFVLMESVALPSQEDERPPRPT